MSDVLRWGQADQAAVRALLGRYQLELRQVADDAAIPGSHWGDEEAGLIRHALYLRNDTPLHSVLHEACHAICMGPQRRAQLHTDAGGDDLEENAVCYLQILLADAIPGFGRERCCADMDRWGYSFRLGSAAAWFAQDAADAREWLRRRSLLPQDAPDPA